MLGYCVAVQWLSLVCLCQLELLPEGPITTHELVRLLGHGLHAGSTFCERGW